ncbi:PP2C family serine/threonine-protein phosphatase [Rhodosalinus sp. 5P4]|uniref:PP2C family protein-serine/threonine phosphatase n=1 Tax=Rhodosalinus sp. 5P4 TaxID=3239196 RepID=UPI0035268740
MLQAAELLLDTASALSQGRRERQEDAVITGFPQGGEIGIAVLSDGMGGHAAGDLASRLIVTEVFSELMLHGAEADRFRDATPAILRHAVEGANESVRAHGDARSDRDGMGGTVVATVVQGGCLHWASVGDSPLYLFRDGALSRLNEDHSLAAQIDLMVSEGLMDAEVARCHPQRNCLSAVLMGEAIERMDCPAEPLPLVPGDVVVMASDGLQFLDDATIAGILGRHSAQSSDAIAAALLDGVAALDDPDQDNVALVVIRVSDAQTPSRRGMAPFLPGADGRFAPGAAAAGAFGALRQLVGGTRQRRST